MVRQSSMKGRHDDDSSHNKNFWKLAFGAIAIVYGDIGTSPIYAFHKAAFPMQVQGTISISEILGCASMVIWSLLLVVTLKYVMIVINYNNNGEGGILALMTLVQKIYKKPVILWLGMIGASLFFGDAIITPAVSILSAVEGLELTLEVSNHGTTHVIALLIVCVVFFLQRLGTASISFFYAPIMFCWFVVIAIIAVPHLFAYPIVFKAFNPYYAIHFVEVHGLSSYLTLSGAFLSITGAEALATDLGHFGKGPIRRAWIFYVAPCLIMNYLGQAAYLIHNPYSMKPFFQLVPHTLLLPLIVLATMAAIIATQAVITGAFSLSYQAIQLGIFPRLQVLHTNPANYGQIYVPKINSLLFLCVFAAILLYPNSNSLTSAYGLAVSGTMLTTSLLMLLYLIKHSERLKALIISLMCLLLVFEVGMVLVNLIKVLDRGYIPIFISLIFICIMASWVRGQKILFERTIHKHGLSFKKLFATISAHKPTMVKGTAIFLTRSAKIAPEALIFNLTHNQVLHEVNIILTVTVLKTSHLQDSRFYELKTIHPHFKTLEFFYGYMDKPNIPAYLKKMQDHGLDVSLKNTTFFVSKQSVYTTRKNMVLRWLDSIFRFLLHNSTNPIHYFNIPSDLVLEIGHRVEFN